MQIEPLKPWHMKALEAQGVKEAKPTYAYLNSLMVPPSFAGVVDAGVVCAMGMVEQNPGNWRCWAITDPKLTRRHFIALNKAMRAFLTEFRKPRIETIVLVGNRAGERWAELHGFVRPRDPMHNYCEHGHAWLYEKVNG